MYSPSSGGSGRGETVQQYRNIGLPGDALFGVVSMGGYERQRLGNVVLGRGAFWRTRHAAQVLDRLLRRLARRERIWISMSLPASQMWKTRAAAFLPHFSLVLRDDAVEAEFAGMLKHERALGEKQELGEGDRTLVAKRVLELVRSATKFRRLCSTERPVRRRHRTRHSPARGSDGRRFSPRVGARS